jgi:exoribonuclease R
VPLRRTVIRGADLTAHLAALRTEMRVPADYPAAAVTEAEQAARELSLDGYADATDVELVTLDPPGSRDLDQAFGITARAEGGFDVVYAIADVAAFVAAGGAVDAEAHARGETLYLPDGRVPLHPTVLSEGAASLLPGERRPAVLWRFRLDADGEPTSVDVRRSVVRSRAQLDYPAFAHTGGELVPLLQRVGELRQARERDRGGVSLPVPEQELERVDKRWELHYRAPLPVEDWNAQLSLLTGMAAARLMLDAGIGVVRTMPAPDDHTVATLRRSAHALGVDWPKPASYADVVRRLDAAVPAQAAMLRLASVLFRGASYVAFDGKAPEQPMQSAVAAPYAHATAPLRRLVDRYVSECCLAACAGVAPPQWVRAALPGLPAAMADADRRAHAVDRAVVDLAEALLLEGRVGERFTGVVVEDRIGADRHGEVQLRDPAVRARLDGVDLPLGQEVEVTLAAVDVTARHVEFVLG